MLSWEVNEILVKPHRPIAAGGYFIVLKVEKLVGWYIVREYVVTMRFNMLGKMRQWNTILSLPMK